MEYGLIGGKLGHSYSGIIHKMLGSYDYRLVSLSEKEFPAFMDKKDFKGVNVTIPYKKSVIAYCSKLSEAAKRIGSVNTLINREGMLEGHNTDYEGFLYIARSLGVDFNDKKALILGGGGTSLTAAACLQDLGTAPVITVSRQGLVNYDNLYDHADARIIVNTTPVGMYPNNGERLINLEKFPALEGVVDVIYNPLKTRLLLDAERLGLPWAGGLLMLVAQAKAAAELFLGRPVKDLENDRIYRQLLKDMRNIVLIGMPGCGKSSVGRLLAERLGRNFVDTDDLIVEYQGMNIPSIFMKYGETRFREIETQILEERGAKTGQVIATGGGAVLRQANRDALRQNGIVIWLQRELECLDCSGRPLSTDILALAEMQQKRRPVYEQSSDIQIINSRNIEETVETIYEFLNNSI